MCAIVGRCDTLVNRFVQYIDKFLITNLIAIETQRTFLVLTFVYGDHNVGHQIVFPVFEDWSPFNVTLTISLEACRACPYPRLARQRVRLVLFADYNLGQFDYLVFQCHGQFVPIGVSCVGNRCRLIGNMRECQVVPAPFGYHQRKVSLCVGDDTYAVLFNANADVFYCLASLINDVTFDLRLRLPRHCSECEQDDDNDGLLVHIRLLLQFAFALKILGECLPLHGILLDVGLRTLVVDELCRVAVVQVVAGIVLILANRGIV